MVIRLPRTPRGILTLVGACFVLAWCGWQAWLWYWRNESVVSAANRISLAYENQDVGTLLYYSYPSELDVYGISREQFARVMREYCWPPMLGAKRTRRILQDSGLGEGIAVVCTQHYDVGGRAVTHNFFVTKTKDGPKAMILYPVISLAMQQKFAGKFPNEHGKRLYYSVIVEGIRQDGDLLRSLGIMGSLQGQPGRHLDRWEATEKQLSDWLRTH